MATRRKAKSKPMSKAKRAKPKAKATRDEPRGRGRPSAYHEKFVTVAHQLTLLGATDAEMASAFGVSTQTLYNWQKEHPDFLDAITRGKVPADGTVAASLFHRATGYSHPEEKIFVSEGKVIRVKTTKHYPPDASSMIFWLKNRQKHVWRDRHELSGDPEAPLVFVSEVPQGSRPVGLPPTPEAPDA